MLLLSDSKLSLDFFFLIAEEVLPLDLLPEAPIELTSGDDREEEALEGDRGKLVRRSGEEVIGEEA